MVTALLLSLRHDRWQSAQLELSTQGINDPQNILESHGRLAGFKIDDEAHTNPSRQGQLGLCQPELLAPSTKCTS